MGCDQGDIFEAVNRGRTAQVEKLLQSDPGLAYARDAVGRTPLHLAAERGDSRTIAFLLERGADSGSLDRIGFSALDYARLSGGEESIALLEDRVSLPEAIRRGEESLMERIVSQDPSVVNRPGPDGTAPIHIALREKNSAALEFLLLKGADPNCVFPNGESPLQKALAEKEIRSVRLLLEAGADPNFLDDRGRTPLYLAIQMGESGIIDLLIEKGANPNIEMTEGLTPLQIAAQLGQRETVEKLIASGGVVETRNENGRDALYWAQKHHHYALAHFIAEIIRIDDD